MLSSLHRNAYADRHGCHERTLSKTPLLSLSKVLASKVISSSPRIWPWIPTSNPCQMQSDRHHMAEAEVMRDFRVRADGKRVETMAAKPALSSSRSRKPLPSASMLRNTFSMDADSCQDIHMQISTAMHRRAHAQQQSVARALPWLASTESVFSGMQLAKLPQHGGTCDTELKEKCRRSITFTTLCRISSRDNGPFTDKSVARGGQVRS